MHAARGPLPDDVTRPAKHQEPFGFAADSAQGSERTDIPVVRRRGEQHDVGSTSGQCRHGFVPVAVPREAVRFVDDDDIPRARGDGGQDIRALDVVHRDDRDRPGRPRIDAVRQRRHAAGHGAKIDDVSLEIEALREFAGPLFAQAGGRDDQHAVGRAARPQLRDGQARLNRLPQSDLVGEQDAAAVAARQRNGGFELVRQQLDAGAPRRAELPLRELVGQQLPAGTPPARRAHEPKMPGRRNRLDRVEGRKQTGFDPEVGRTKT